MSLDDFNAIFAPDSTANLEEKIDVEALFEKIKASTSSILEEKFRDTPEKQDIVNRNNRINFACPSCGDSKWNKSKKRGNIYLQGYNYKCYNSESKWCAYTRSIVGFLSHFGRKDDYTSLELAYLDRNTNENHQITLGSSGINFSTHATDLFGIDEFAIPRSKIVDKLKLVDIEKNTKITNYLIGRKQIDIRRNDDLRHLAYDLFNDRLYIFNMTPDKEKVIGIQYRVQKLRRYGDPRFISFKYSSIWLDIFKVEIKDEIKNAVDRFSLIYNILMVNYAKDIYIFEASIDSHHLQNSLATWGASAKIYLENGKYFYDNSLEDKAGQKAAIEMLKEGFNTFLWGKFLKDYPQFRFCTDLNDIFVKEPIEQEVIDKYFGKEPIDIVHL